MEVTDNTFERLELPPVRADDARAANPEERSPILPASWCAPLGGGLR